MKSPLTDFIFSERCTLNTHHTGYLKTTSRVDEALKRM
jgi:hypothetical protein